MESFGFDKLPDAVKFLLEKIEHIEKLLLDLKPASDDPGKMMDIKEAAAFLNITVTALYALVSRKDIPVNKPGKRLYFDKNELITWIKAGRKKTNREIEQTASARTSPYRRRLNQ